MVFKFLFCLELIHVLGGGVVYFWPLGTDSILSLFYTSLELFRCRELNFLNFTEIRATLIDLLNCHIALGFYRGSELRSEQHGLYGTEKKVQKVRFWNDPVKFLQWLFISSRRRRSDAGLNAISRRLDRSRGGGIKYHQNWIPSTYPSIHESQN